MEVRNGYMDGLFKEGGFAGGTGWFAIVVL